jgi:hypothetical protein
MTTSSPSVVPVDWSAFTAGLPADAGAQRMAAILLNTNRYALTTWYFTVKNFASATQQPANYLDLGGTAEANIRPVASEALALAVSLKTGLYDPAVTGVDAYSAVTKAAKLIRSLAHPHVANMTGGWGDEWQSALWAALTGMAGWLMWDSVYLSDADRENIRRMVEHEANRFVGYQVPYYRNLAGTIVFPGDSKAEENAWNAMILQVATAMMPAHPSVDAWSYKMHELMLSAFARPADTGSATVINGRSMASWLYGSNANDDGVVINHNILHPDYMTTVSTNAFCALTSSLAGRPTPAAAFVNSDKVYRALVDLNFTPGSAYPPGPALAAPGGTIYRVGSPDIYYPQGDDWGTARRAHFALADAMAHAFGFDTTCSRDGAYWEALHAQQVLEMQNLNADRRTYTTAAQDTYSGREEWVAAHAGQAYLTKWLVHQGAFSRSTAAVPIVVDNLDREFSVMAGTWTVSPPADRLGPNVRYSPAGSGANRVRFTPRLPAPGSYRVYAWWTAYPNHATNAPYVIHHTAGTSTVTTNQESNGGHWNLLGTYGFAAGTAGYVEVNNNANEYVVADGVKFELVA